MDLENIIQTSIANQNNLNQRLINSNGVITIPVVVHVLNCGENIGVGRNISDAQIQSQIDVLNEDFRRLNPDKTNTPSVFSAIAADFGIEFKLACIDPNGYGTSGIIRKNTNKSSYSLEWETVNTDLIDEVKTKIKTSEGSLPWPTDRYLNIWVCKLNDALGVSSFPGDFSTRSNFDGIVINYTAFGRIGSAEAPFNLGRTASHEVGHWLDLRHIWGDADCGFDFVPDTPPQKAKSSGCPNFPQQTTCNNTASGEMFMNYMDYSNDGCMNIFTTGQKQRGRSVFTIGTPRLTIIENNFKIQMPASIIRCQGKVKLTNYLCLPSPVWSVLSGPATILYGQNTDEITIKSTGVGNVTLRADAGNNRSEIVVPVKFDGPDPIIGVNTTFRMFKCNVIGYKHTVVGGEAATLYKWSYRNITQGTPFVVYATTGNNFAGSPNGEGSCDQIEIKVEAINPCNTTSPPTFTFLSDMCYPFVDGSCSYGRTLLASPSPSVTNVQLKLVDEPNVIPANKQPKKIKQVRVVDRMGQIKQTYTGNNLDIMTINLSNLPADIYTILVSDGKVWMSKQVSKN